MSARKPVKQAVKQPLKPLKSIDREVAAIDLLISEARAYWIETNNPSIRDMHMQHINSLLDERNALTRK